MPTVRTDIASDGAERKPAALPAFAPVPWAALRAGDRLSDGAVKAYALLCGLARVQNPRPEDPGDYGEFEDVRPPAGGWGAALGCTDRTARRWIAELIDAEFVIREAEAEFVIVHAEGPRALISLELLDTLSPALWRAWAVIQSRLNRFGRVTVTRETLAADLGVNRVKTVSDRLRALAACGVLAKHRRKRRANLYMGHKFRAGTDPDTRTKTAHQDGQKPPIKRTDSAHQADKNRPQVIDIEEEKRGIIQRDSGAPAKPSAPPPKPLRQSNLTLLRSYSGGKTETRTARQDNTEQPSSPHEPLIALLLDTGRARDRQEAWQHLMALSADELDALKARYAA